MRYMMGKMEEIIVCVMNKCPFCGARGYSEGVNSVKIGEKIKCEKCGKKFEVEWTRNIKGEKETLYENEARNTASARRVGVRTTKKVSTPVRRAKTPARARKTTKTVPIEDVECMNFASWLRDRNIPHTHIPNESRSGKKDAAIRARKLQKMGVSRGVWDYEIWAPIYNCDGEIDDYQLLKIEMKRQRGGGSTTSPEQRKWGKIYAAAGVPCKVCYGAAEAEAFVEEYWRDPRFNDNEVF